MPAPRSRRHLALLALPLLIACAPAGSPTGGLAPGDPAQLLPVGSLWVVESLADFTLPADNGMLLRRDADTLSGTTACNRFVATLTVADEALQLGPVALTRRACLGHAARQEAAFTAALARIDGVAAVAGGAADARPGHIALTEAGQPLITLAPAPVDTPPAKPVR